MSRWPGGWCTDSADALGWRLGSDGFRIVLTAELADVVERRLGGVVTSFLARHGLTVDEISCWLGHPGGPKVLDAIQHSLKLPDRAVELSRRSLAEAGNLSSVSVLHVLELTADTRPPPAGSYLAMPQESYPRYSSSESPSRTQSHTGDFRRRLHGDVQRNHR